MKTFFEILTWLFSIITLIIAVATINNRIPVLFLLISLSLALISFIIVLNCRTHYKISDLADSAAEAIDLDNLKEEVLQGIKDEKAQPTIIRLQEDILKNTANVKAFNRGAFNAFIRGLNQEKDILMLQLILHQVQENNVKITGKVEDIIIDTCKIPDIARELIYHYHEDRKKKNAGT